MRCPQVSRLAAALGLSAVLWLGGGVSMATVLFPPPTDPVPVAAPPAAVTNALLTSLQATYLARCLHPLFGEPLPPYAEKACVVLEVLLDGLYREQAQLCNAAPAPSVCSSAPGVPVPWPSRVE